ncbi:urease accessory protein UreD [Arthrobacter sp. H5]|uniref:urease accessory protein UreD n=1 Tax=Arthrobacter sp. H5 TaxID=1267973 RepID=UPI0004B912FC|nr:urease accessory protein UreD [Arthrobacter sp. H5]
MNTRMTARVAPPRTPTRLGALAGRPARISVGLVNGRARFSRLDQGDFLAPRPVHGTTGSDAHRLRVALIGTGMMLLGGDHVCIEVEVGAGVTLEIVEPAGLVAYNADGVESSWALQATVHDGGTLIWDGATFVAGHGSNVVRRTEVLLNRNSRVLLRECLVLGRSGEVGGDLRSVTRLRGGAGDLLVEDLDLTGHLRGSVGVMGSSKVLASVTAAGWRPSPELPAEAMLLTLASPGAVARSMADSAHTAVSATDKAFGAWRTELMRAGR